MHRVERNSSAPSPATAEAWWRSAVFYQVYIRSFYDSDGNGIGDLDGIRERLGYLTLLGVDAIWITPFYPSPMADHGYDVADFRDVDRVFGDLAAFDRLVAAAHEEGIKVTVDLVPNHTSYAHAWFAEAVAAEPGSAARARYLFRDGRGPDGSQPPNNWQSIFGGPAWSRVADGQWYLHLFAPQQPDLNWQNPEVLADFEKTMQFWLDRGVDGFRVDVAHGMAKPDGLPDAPTPPPGGMYEDGTKPVDPRFDNDGVHDIHRAFRRIADKYPDRVITGEAWVADPERLVRYVRPDELHLSFNFSLLEAEWDARQFTTAITDSLAALATVGAPATWVLSNHDVVREATRYGGGEVGTRRARAAALLLLSLPGAAYLYNGEELGLPNVELPDAVLQDPTWERSGHTERGRDGERVPMPWSGAAPPYDFSDGMETWLPMPDGWEGLTVEAQLEDPDSMLSLYRGALDLRHSHPAISGDQVEWFGAPEGCLAFRRTGGLVCALNAGDAPVPMPPGELLLASGPLLDGALPPDTAVWLA